MRLCVLGCALVGCGISDVSFSAGALDGTISVSAYHFGSEIPFAGTEVQFIAPDQSVQTVTTDANGFAEAVSPPNTRVVVFQDMGRADLPLVRVFDAANPGDHIVAGLRTPTVAPDLGTIRFSLPQHPGWGNHGFIVYALQISCSPDNGPDPSPERDMRIEGCPHATNATAVGWIQDGSSGELLSGPSVLRNIDLTAHLGETIQMPPYRPKLLTTVSGQFVNTPPGEQLSWATEAYYDDDPTTFAVGSTFDPPPNVVNTRPAMGIGERTLSSLSVTLLGYATLSNLQVDPGFAANYFVDWDASRRMKYVSHPDFSAFTQTLTWSVSADGQPPQMFYVQLIVFSGARRYWIELYAPGDRTSLTLPTLPPQLTPQLSDSVHKRGGVYRISNETYSEWLQAASSRDPFSVTTWSSEMPREIWFSFIF